MQAPIARQQMTSASKTLHERSMADADEDDDDTTVELIVPKAHWGDSLHRNWVVGWDGVNLGLRGVSIHR